MFRTILAVALLAGTLSTPVLAFNASWWQSRTGYGIRHPIRDWGPDPYPYGGYGCYYDPYYDHHYYHHSHYGHHYW